MSSFLMQTVIYICYDFFSRNNLSAINILLIFNATQLEKIDLPFPKYFFQNKDIDWGILI